ncbi:MAG: DNA recombination protein RmuC [Anaerolineae bacterium]|nr:DNA recombination protein RmuC [Anaerolineae bacterium]NIN96693.1 DNA recombination protein RmuC [Anaerolineae bacterium]NIQ79704.1 DNA recombination protein RmuC [Anaerolineae bacterium]
MDPLMLVLIVLVVLLLGAVLLLLGLQVLQFRSSQRDVETAVISQKLSQLEPVSQAVSSIQQELAELQAYTKAYTRARQDLERQTAESIRRLETVIAGTQTKGVAGENILEAVFANLPPEWQVRNFRVGDRSVEFGLRLPNNLVLPIDSKWPATHLLEQFMDAEEPEEQQKLKSQIEKAVLDKAKEVRKYIDPNVTVNFGIAAVPDAVYDLSTGVQADVFQLNVVLIGYSMFVPYLLLVFQTILKSSQTIDMQRLDAYLRSAEENIEAAQGELEGRFSRAITMLTNSRDELGVLLSKVRSGLTSLQISAARGGPEELPEPVGSEEAQDVPRLEGFTED